MIDRINNYINKDLYGLSYDEFCKKINYGIDLSKIEMAGKIEYAILLLNLKDSPIHFSQANENYTLKRFDGVVLLSERIDGSEWNMLNPSVYANELNLKLFNGNIDIKTFNFGGNDENTITLSRIRTIQEKDKRGLVPDGKNAINYYHAFLMNNDKWYTSLQNYIVAPLSEVYPKRCSDLMIQSLDKEKIYPDQIYKTEKGHFTGRQLFLQAANTIDCLYPIPDVRGYMYSPSDIQAFLSNPDHKKNENIYRANLSLALTFHYEWFVYIRETPQSIGFKIPILPQNYNEIFSLRDIPEGVARRKALVHFVKEHSRKIKRDDSDVSVLVHKYLRGETKFNWKGLDVHVIPSQSDIINTKSKKKFINK